MRFSLYAMAAGTFTGVLTSLSGLLDKGAAYAAAQGWDAAKLPNTQLAPDMFSLIKQVQVACDQAKNSMARLAAQEPPKFADDEQTIEDLKARIAKTIAYIESVPEAAFGGAEERQIVVPLFEDMVLDVKGAQLLRDWSLPHFYFHVVTAYDIMRHSGVELSKRDYMSHIGSAIRKLEAA